MNKEIIRDIEIPLEKLVSREKMAMARGQRKRRANKLQKRSLLVACVLTVSLLGSGFLSTNMANALSNIPLIGTIYQDFRDIASEKIERDALVTLVNQQDSHSGVTMTVKEAAYDGNRLMVSVMYTAENGVSLDEQEVGFSTILINGEPVERVSGSTAQDDVDGQTVIEHHQLNFAEVDIYGDKIEVAVKGHDVFGTKGEWEVAFPLAKVDGDVQVFSPNSTSQTKDGQVQFTAEQVTFSPLATRIDVKVDYPIEMDSNDTWPGYEVLVQDATGNTYEGLKLQRGMMPGTFGHHMVFILPPLDEIPDSFTLLAGQRDKEGYLHWVDELQLTIPLTE